MSRLFASCGQNLRASTSVRGSQSFGFGCGETELSVGGGEWSELVFEDQ